MEQVGIINKIPEPIAEANKDELICETMQHNWNVIIKKFRRALRSKQMKKSTQVLSIRKERVQRCKKVYVAVYITPLVLKGVFGCDFCLTPREIIVHQTKNMTVLHIFSAENCNYILL